ncbi:MAG: phosphate ABC transporter substrate-binding protein [Methanomassiliicoccales archaeon]|nr:phosphate ABC transporter substrate-binding protein [Methanomassiliicoccales archaeon]
MENKTKYAVIGVVAIMIVAAIGFAVLNQGEDGSITITQKGSDTMLELCQYWAEDFMTENDNVTVEISGGGSSTGFTALISGQVDLAQASRQIKSSELASANSSGVTPVEFKVAIDGISIITSDDNTIQNLTMEQLRGIYNGTITNWNQVGGADHAITLYGRQSTSGTYEYFWEVVLKKENYSASMNMLSGNSAIVAAVQGDEYGIGYVGLGYANATGIEIVDLKANESSTAFSPKDKAAVLDGDYALSRYLYIYSDGTPTGAIADWLEWILTADGGQAVAEEVGFYALPSDMLSEQLAKLS